MWLLLSVGCELGCEFGRATQVMLTGLLPLRNMLNTSMVCAKHLG
jgi:hypothetical protein